MCMDACSLLNLACLTCICKLVISICQRIYVTKSELFERDRRCLCTWCRDFKELRGWAP
jgi:hypothetical protein